MINFTVGPVQSDEEILKIGAEQVPYFRTPEFSETMLENEALIKEFANASDNSRVVFITGSGTASMEASVINTLSETDKALVVKGGSFGARFEQLLTLHNIPHDVIELEIGQPLTEEILSKYNPEDYNAFLVNVHETSTGVHYDLGLIHEFCAKNNIFLIVDAISSFLADEVDMQKNGIDLMITGSQKALACPPGISLIVLSENALKRVENTNPKCMYFDLKDALKNGERGQTPFTPAVSILLQINARLKAIKENGGAKAEIERTCKLAEYFRSKITDFPFEILSKSPSNAVTALVTKNNNAKQIFTELKDNYGIWICPNGGDLADKIFRVGHIGNLTEADYDKLLAAFADLQQKGIL